MISLKNIYKTFITEGVKTPVLKGVSLSIEKGEFVAIMGPSGSGKSTLMHVIGLLDKVSRGVYKMEGEKVSSFDDDELAGLRNQKLGFVFQAFHLIKRMSVLENVELPLIYSSDKVNHKQLATDALKAVGLGHRLDYYANQISGGEKQRVAIARALVNDPEIILADEPTGNLDSKSGLRVMKILEKLNKQGKTIILVTHETYTAEHARRIIRIVDGKIVSDKANRHQRKVNGKGTLK